MFHCRPQRLPSHSWVAWNTDVYTWDINQQKEKIYVQAILRWCWVFVELTKHFCWCKSVLLKRLNEKERCALSKDFDSELTSFETLNNLAKWVFLLKFSWSEESGSHNDGWSCEVKNFLWNEKILAVALSWVRNNFKENSKEKNLAV